MKKLLLLTLLIFGLVMLFTSCALAQNDITVFGQPVTLNQPLLKSQFGDGFPLSIGATSVMNCVAKNLSSNDILNINKAVKNAINMQNPPTGTPVFTAFFTTQTGADSSSIIKNSTHAFCMGLHTDSVLTLYYYEKDFLGNFLSIKNLTTKINYSSEEVLLALHYSHFTAGTFPANSTVFSFFADTQLPVRYADESDMIIALSKDSKRVAGLNVLGMGDSLVLANLNINGQVFCPSPCPDHTPNSGCLEDWDDLGIHYNCGVAATCGAASAQRRAQEEHIDLGVDFKFKLMRQFRDGFMTKYCEGKKYIGFYYAFSRYAKMNISMLWKYAAVLPALYDAIDNLSDNNTDKVIFTSSLKDKVIEILDAHSDVKNTYLQSVFAEVKADMERFVGMKRSQIIAMLTPANACNGVRKGSTDEIRNRQFVTVYEDPDLKQIIVNYVVPGTSVKFELYSSAGKLITTISNVSASQKLNISTEKLNSGVYLYRLISDVGYESAGKVAIVK